MELISLVEESWGEKWLKIARLRDADGNVLELVEGPWGSHISIQVKEFPRGWKGETAEPVRRGRLKVWFGPDPDGNRVELVKEGG